jgi:hypothetical protein
MGGPITLIYPDGTVTEDDVDRIPAVGQKIGALVVARVELKKPDDEADTGTWVYLQKAEE